MKFYYKFMQDVSFVFSEMQLHNNQNLNIK